MADKQLRYVVSAVDKGAGKTIAGVASQGEGASRRLGSAFGKVGQFIGGEVAEAFTKAGEVVDTFGEKSHSAGEKIAAIGAAGVGAGMLLMSMGAHEKQATDQLNVAIENTGKSVDDIDGKIEHAVKSMEKYGDNAVQTKDSLTTLTNATHDPQKALDLLATAADLAAAKHISLNDASEQLAKGLNGSTRIFKQYGVVVKTNADGTKDYAGAVQQLAQIVHGQAAAAADNFNGKLRKLRAEVEDGVSAFGQKYGGAITSAGVAMVVLGPVVTKSAALVKGMGRSFVSAGAEAGVGAAEITAADEEIVAANEAAAASATQVGGAAAASRGGILAGAGALGVLGAAAAGVAVGGFALNKAIEGHAVQDMFTSIHNTSDAAKDLNTQLVNNGYALAGIGTQWAKAAVDSTGLAQKAAAAGITVDQLTHAITGGADATNELIAQWEKSGSPSDATKVQLASLAVAYSKASDAAEANAGTVANTGPVISIHALQMQAAAKAADLWTNALGKLGGAQMGEAQSLDSYKDSVDAVTQSVHDNGTTLDVNSAKGRANRETLIAGLQAAVQYASAQRNNGVAISKVNSTLNANVHQLEATAQRAGFSKAQVHALVAQMGLTPKQINTTFNADTAPAYAKFNQMVADLRAAAANAGIYVTVNAEGGQTAYKGGTTHNAGGTEYFPGGSTGIAEREPEIVARRGVTITPLSKLANGTSDKQVVVNVTVNTLTTDAQVQRWLVGQIEGAVRSGMRIAGVTS